MPIIVHAQCPSPPRGSSWQSPGLVRDIIEYANVIHALGVDVSFGIELRAAFLIDRMDPKEQQLYTQSVRRVFLRPAIEPILYANRDDLLVRSTNDGLLNNVVSMTQCRIMALRQGAIESSPNEKGHLTHYPDVAYSHLYLDRCRSGISAIEDPLQRAFFVFAEAIISHPYADGNGRLARALMFGEIRRSLDLPFFDVPFAPAVLQNSDDYFLSLLRLTLTGDWEMFFAKMSGFVKYALFLARQILRLPGTLSED